MSEIKIQNIAANYKELYTTEGSDEKIQDLDIFTQETESHVLNAADYKETYYSDKANGTTITAEFLIEQYDGRGPLRIFKNDVLGLKEFQRYFKNNDGSEIKDEETKSQIEDLYYLISSLDGTDGITAEELQYVMDLDKEGNGLTKEAISNFLKEVQTQVGIKDTDNTKDTEDTEEADSKEKADSEEEAGDTEIDEEKAAEEAAKKAEEEAKEKAKAEAKAQRKEQFDNNIVENYNTLNSSDSSTAIEDLSIIKEETNFKGTFNRADKFKAVYDKDNDNDATAQEIFDYEKAGDNLSYDKFKDLITKNKRNDQTKELYDLISSLDGKEGLSAEELQYVMDFSDDGNITSEDINLFLAQVKKEVKEAGITTSSASSTEPTIQTDSTDPADSTDSTGTAAAAGSTGSDESTTSISKTTIEKGDTPIGLMNKIEGATLDDYNTLMEMNIKAGNIKDTTMIPSQIKKYSTNSSGDNVKYMLHPDMNIALYSKEDIENYKETGELPKVSGQSGIKNGNEDETEYSFVELSDNIKVCTKNDKNYSFTYTTDNETISYDGTKFVISKFDDKGNIVSESYDATDSGFEAVEKKDVPKNSDLYEIAISNSTILKIGDDYFFNGQLYDKDGNLKDFTRTESYYDIGELTYNQDNEITAYNYSSSDCTITCDGSTLITTRYDENGNQTYKSVYTIDGDNYTYTKNDNGKITELSGTIEKTQYKTITVEEFTNSNGALESYAKENNDLSPNGIRFGDMIIYYNKLYLAGDINKKINSSK